MIGVSGDADAIAAEFGNESGTSLDFDVSCVYECEKTSETVIGRAKNALYKVYYILAPADFDHG